MLRKSEFKRSTPMKQGKPMSRGAPMKQTGFKKNAVPVPRVELDADDCLTETERKSYGSVPKPVKEPRAAPIKKASFKAKRTKRKPGASDPVYLGLVAGLGCRLCRLLGMGWIACEVHHRRTGTGGGRRAPDSETVGLCPEHHRGASGIHGLGRKLFERTYGHTELELISMTKKDLGITEEPNEAGAK